MRKVKSQEVKKHPLLKSSGQILLLIFVLIILILIVDYFDDIGEVSCILGYEFFISGIVGSIVILINNYKSKNYLKVYGVVTLIVLVVSGTASGIYGLYGKNLRAKEICGNNGNLYYCESEEPITCDDGNYAVIDDSSYKCVNSNVFRHDYRGEEYDYTCIGKYEDAADNVATSLTLEEKACLEGKMETTFNELIKEKQKGMEPKYDIRNRVNVIAGDQGMSDTCELWSSTKALEISAQLKGLDYQFLIDFESKINGLDANIDGIVNEDDNTIILGSDHLIPGKKRYYAFNAPSLNEDYINIPTHSIKLTKLIDDYSNVIKRVNADKNEYNIFDGFDKYWVYDKELESLYVKELVKKQGSAFIKTNYDIHPGHSMIIIGWDDSKEAWLVLNSWGNTWSSDKYVPNSNGDGTTWIKYSDKNFVFGISNDGGNAIELISE